MVRGALLGLGDTAGNALASKTHGNELGAGDTGRDVSTPMSLVLKCWTKLFLSYALADGHYREGKNRIATSTQFFQAMINEGDVPYSSH